MDLKLVFWELSAQNIYNKKGLQTGSLSSNSLNIRAKDWWKDNFSAHS